MPKNPKTAARKNIQKINQKKKTKKIAKPHSEKYPKNTQQMTEIPNTRARKIPKK